ncbi:hypothetical protein [Amycolatopsis aidingensis]|uniref:hypothetical protein n=1 Tax=Amycolatopsis aidingensis TaxID=2842453 RepID=UPI001C0B4FE7|nr:hypothetical protein [Amycolatopsis aidingensis]
MDIVQQFRELNTVTERFARAHRRSQGLDQRGEQVACLMSTIVRAAFNHQDAPDRAVRTRLGLDLSADLPELHDFVRLLEELQDRIRNGTGMSWDLAARTGGQLDPTWQEPWKTSIPDAPIRLVVFPALRGPSGKVLVKQQVYTVGLRAHRDGASR